MVPGSFVLLGVLVLLCPDAVQSGRVERFRKKRTRRSDVDKEVEEPKVELETQVPEKVPEEAVEKKPEKVPIKEQVLLQKKEGNVRTDEIMPEIAGSKQFPNLWKPDHHTAFGSTLNTSRHILPNTVIGVGFEGCGTNLLARVLAKHDMAIVAGKTAEKNYFTGKNRGNCNRFSAKKGQTAYEKYILGCFKGRVPNISQATIDVSAQYSLYAWDGAIRGIKELQDTATLRFLAVVCDPRDRAVWSTRYSMQRPKTHVTDEDVDANVSATLRLHEQGTFAESIAVGEYYRMLSEWVGNFPRDSMLVINSHSLRIPEIWQRIFLHIGLEVPSRRAIKRWISRAKNKVPAHSTPHQALTHPVQTRLTSHYTKFNDELWKMLGTQWW